MVSDALKRYYGRHESELEMKYLRKDPGYQEREQELKEAISQFEPVLHGLSQEIWLKFDLILTAHNQCEAYAMQMMYVGGVQDTMQVMSSLLEEDDNGGNSFL